ncbi:MAG: hypothetical protein JST54_30590 [Deltaproteobacteria bacterium]|nr:hypothetical protein [Deltaproteobacteria bacterium]
MATKIQLPSPAELERRAKLVTLLEMLIEPDFEPRYHEFYEDWDAKARERVLGIRTGEGDHAFIFFSPKGTLVRGWVKGKASVEPARLFADLPKSLARARDEKAFQLGGDSFAFWWSGKGWASSVDPERGGASNLLFALDGKPRTFSKWAADYHDARVDPRAVEALYEGAPVSPALVAQLSSEFSADEALALAMRLGLPANTKAAMKKTDRGAKAKVTLDDDEGPVGDAEFKVVELDGETMLIIAGKPQLRSKTPGLYDKVLANVRKTLGGR